MFYFYFNMNHKFFSLFLIDMCNVIGKIKTKQTRIWTQAPWVIWSSALLTELPSHICILKAQFKINQNSETASSSWFYFIHSIQINLPSWIGCWSQQGPSPDNPNLRRIGISEKWKDINIHICIALQTTWQQTFGHSISI